MMNKIWKLKAKKGFTMVELIVVIAIIAVLSAIIIPLSMNYLNNAQITSANKSASAIVNAWNIEVNNRALQGQAVGTGVFRHDFSTNTATILNGTPLPDVATIQNVMQTIFPSQSNGVVVVQIIADSGTVACTAAVFSETAVVADCVVTGSGTTISYGSTTPVPLMTLATADAGVITPAAVILTNDNPPNTGAIVFGYSPQP